MQEEGNDHIAMEQDSQKREASIGTLLADARSHAALSQADVAARMNLRVGIIQALEKDDFESLPQSTYVRGYLRMYAGIVGLDSGHLVGIYNERHHVEPEYHPRPRPHAVRKSATLWNTVAVVTILASLFVVWQVYVKRQPVQIAEPADSQSEPVSSAGRPLAPDIPGTAVHNAGQTSPPHVKEGVRAEQASPRIEKGGSARVSSGQQVSQGRADDTLPAEGAQVVENEPGGEDSARVSSGQQASQGRADDTLPAEGAQVVENEPGGEDSARVSSGQQASQGVRTIRCQRRACRLWKMNRVHSMIDWKY